MFGHRSRTGAAATHPAQPSKEVTLPAVEHAPLYDPAAHTVDGGDPTVFAEMYCKCGSVWRQRDPVSLVLPFLESWQKQHTGAGHGEATKAQAIAEREKRREAAHVMKGIGDQYEPKPYDRFQVDDELRPWPALEG
jgi:hypothetical protein